MKKNIEPIRILQVGMHDKIGGVETFLMNYYRNIDRDKVQFDFVSMFDKLCFQEEIIELGGKIHNVPSVKKNPFRYYRELVDIIKENNYNIIHINMLSMANILPIIAAKRAKVKHIILHSHNTSTPHGVIRKLLDKINKKIAIKNATDLFACSELAGNWMFNNNQQFSIINNAIDLNKYKYNPIIRERLRNELKIQDKFVIGNIARFSEQKNHDFLIDVFKDVSLREPSAILLLIGEGELKEKIEEKVSKYGLTEKVIFIKPVMNINDYYQAMDVFVLPSLFEGLPIVGIEAQASGTTCIFSNTITKELKLTDFSTFVDIESKENWANAIINIKSNGKMKIEDTNLVNKYNIVKETEKLMGKYLSFDV